MAEFELKALITGVDRLSPALSKMQKKIRGFKRQAEEASQGGLALGGGLAAGLTLSLKSYADQENAATGLKVAMMDANGEVGKSFQDINKLAIGLGNQLPGTTADFQNMMQMLVRQGIPAENILGGVGKATAYLAVQLKKTPEAAAEFAAKMQDATGTASEDMMGLFDTIQKAFYLGVDDTNMLSFFTKTSSVLKMVNKDGLQAAQSLCAGDPSEGASAMNDNVTLRVNGREWNGWTSVRIGAGIERLARDFSVEITRQWPGDEGITTLQPRIKNGSKVEVLIGDERVITGWVEATPVRYDARSVSTGIAGRSLTADLIDCAAEPTQFNGRSLVQIAQALAAPFGIEVVNSGAPSGVIPDVQPDHGETVIEVINKILGQQQALAYDDPHGRLVIGGIGSTRAHTALVLGENILSCDTEKSIRERFSVYQVAGQRAGNDDDFGEATTTALRARTEDAFIARYRPMYIRQTGQATGAGCIARADFEARQRAARTDETTYVVQGWRQGNGTLWQPNQRVIVFDPVCGFDNTELLVSEVTFTQDQNGTLTEIRVGPPDAYLPEPEAPGARKKKKARVQEDPF